MARVRKSYPCSGPLYHREHRSKKGRKNLSLIDKDGSLRRKKKLEQLKLKDLYE